MVHKLPRDFYQSPDTLALCKKLLGKFLMTEWQPGERTGGMIVETEAYMGPEDKAAHSVRGRRTNRTEVMYRAGGVGYVYLCYGMHHLFNIITHEEGIPHGILIRAIEPVDGIDIMLKRMDKSKPTSRWTSGPALVSRALGIDVYHSGTKLDGNEIWVEDRGIKVPSTKIIASPRVGIDYAEEYIEKPWRFRIQDNPWTSRAK